MRGGTAWELNPDNAGQGGEPEGGGVKTRVEKLQMEVWGGGGKIGVQVRREGGEKERVGCASTRTCACARVRIHTKHTHIGLVWGRWREREQCV